MENDEASALRVLGIDEVQLRILSLIAQGNNTDRIAEKLDMTRDTVKSSLTALKRTLPGKDRGHLVAMAFRLGMLSWSEEGRILIEGARL